MPMMGWSELKSLLDFILDSISLTWDTLYTGLGLIGVFIIGMPILRKLLSIFRKIF